MRRQYRSTVSVTVEREVIEPGETTYLQDAWELKERIRREEGVLKQRRGFFTDAYRRSTVQAYVTAEDQLIGFAATRRDGYILFLAVAPEFRGDGYAKRLVAAVAEEHSSVTCHARTTNAGALGFYESVGFERVRRVNGYYEDGGDAFYLRLGEGDLKSKLSRFVGL